MLKSLARLTALLAAIAVASTSHAQGVVQQQGVVTPGHPAVWNGNGQLVDGLNYPGTTIPSLLGANSWSLMQTFPGGATFPGISGSTQCLEVNSSGVVSGSGGSCGSPLGVANTWTAPQSFSAGLAGPIGASAPSTGAFTGLSASGAVSGAGFTNYFASPPTLGSTTPNTGAFTTLTANSYNGYAPAPHAANNAALNLLSTASAAAIIRDGFAAAGDAPAIQYVASNSACSLNGGNGDGGFQVKSADSKCWLIAPAAFYDIREFGFTTSDATGATNGPAMTDLFADTGAHGFFIPSGGKFVLPCGTYYNAASAISFYGAGEGASTLQLASGCTINSGTFALFQWSSFSHVHLQNFTLDMNGAVGINTQAQIALSFNANAANTTDLLVRNVGVINAGTYMLLIDYGAAGGNTYSGVVIDSNYLAMTAGSHHFNECINATTNDAWGQLTSAQITNNVCVNSGFEIDGAYTNISGNDISGWGFGAGISQVWSDTTHSATPSAYGCVIANNVLHDSMQGVDDNSTSAHGIEQDCLNALVVGNVFRKLGAEGVVNWANGTTYIGNLFVDNDQWSGSSHCAICVDYSGQSTGNYNSQKVTVQSNRAYDDQGSPTQLYGYVEQLSQPDFHATLRGNDFSGTQQAYSVSVNSITTAVLDGSFASVNDETTAVASIAFTGLDTASYHRWELDCHDLFPATATTIGIQVGEGATPTWETASTYFVSEWDNTSGSLTNLTNATEPSIFLGTGSYANSANNGAGNFHATIGDLSRAVGNKLFSFYGSYTKNAVGSGAYGGTGAWEGDTNAITAIRIIAASGNISGSCTLKGFVQ